MNLPRGYAMLPRGRRLRRSDKVFVNGAWQRNTRYGVLLSPTQISTLQYARKIKRDKADELQKQIDLLTNPI